MKDLQLYLSERAWPAPHKFQPIASRFHSLRKPKSCSLLILAKDHFTFTYPILCSIAELKLGFSRTKDRIFATYETISGWLSRRSKPVRNLVYRVLGGFFWLAYLRPASTVRPTMVGLAKHVGAPSATALFRSYVRRFMTGAELAERVRHGFGSELDGKLTIPDKSKLDMHLETGGVFLALPHLHASVAMIRCLSQSYPVLAIVRLTRDKDRARAQHDLYKKVGCEFLDARGDPPTTVARQILKALKAGKIVVGIVDRIQKPPATLIDKTKDVVRVTGFGSPVGFDGWPTRFAAKAQAPILPGFVTQTDGRLTLLIGNAIAPSADIVASTQDLVSQLEGFITLHPDEWPFSVDKHWSRALQNGAAEATT
jgi:lauroyl/myristoyl acyltransferase